MTGLTVDYKLHSLEPALRGPAFFTIVYFNNWFLLSRWELVQ